MKIHTSPTKPAVVVWDAPLVFGCCLFGLAILVFLAIYCGKDLHVLTVIAGAFLTAALPALFVGSFCEACCEIGRGIGYFAAAFRGPSGDNDSER